jgi:hypothetical protein
MFEKITNIVWKNKVISESIGYISLLAMIIGVGGGIIFSPSTIIGKLVGISLGLMISSVISLIASKVHKNQFNLSRSKNIIKYLDNIDDADIVLEQNDTAKIEAKDFLSLKQYIGILRRLILQQYISLHQEQNLDNIIDQNFLKENSAKFVSLNKTFPHAFKINVFDQIKSFSFFNYAMVFKDHDLLNILLKLEYEIKPIDILSLKENVEDAKFKEPIDDSMFNFLLEKQFYNGFDSELKKAVVSQLQENPKGKEKLLTEYIKELANPENAKILENGEISVNLYKDIYKTLALHKSKLKGKVLEIIEGIEEKIRTIQSMQVENYTIKIELSSLFDKDLPTLLNSYQEIVASPRAHEYEQTLIDNLTIINDYLDDLINNKELDLSFNFKTQSNLVASKYKRENDKELSLKNSA